MVPFPLTAMLPLVGAVEPADALSTSASASVSLASTEIVAVPPDVVAESGFATGGVLTTVEADAVLSLSVLSVLVPTTVAVSVAGSVVPSSVTVTATVAVAPFASAPTVQTTVPAGVVQLPALGVAETTTAPVGRVSVIVTPGSS